MPNTGMFNINALGIEQYLFSLNRWAELVEFLPREMWEEVARAFYDNEERIFDAEGTPESFAPLSARYAAWKSTRFPGMPIMQLHGNLKDALTGRGAAPGKAVPIKRFLKQGVSLGVRSPYAHRHQEGTHGMPQRKVMQSTAALRIQYAKISQIWLVRLERESFGGLLR